jgi:orotate phosphoribosyltransferase
MVESRKIAEILLNINCVQLSPEKPFAYASGLKGPIYCDNRKLLSHVKERNFIVESFIKIINSSGENFDQIAGLATGGIPHAAFISQLMERPMIYIRSKAKGHGKGNQIEGDLSLGKSVILIEDLVNQASSIEKAIIDGRNSGLEIDCAFSIVDYCSPVAIKILKNLNVKLHSLTQFETIIDTALDLKKINVEQRNMLLEWQLDPVAWSKKIE